MPKRLAFLSMRTMRLLLDTCIVYDWLMGRIGDHPVITLIRSEGACVRTVSVWEMAIKNGLGKIPLPSNRIAEDIEAQGFEWLTISPYHAQGVLAVADHHKDPFDRMLIAQATHVGLRVVTYDLTFQKYLDDVLIARK